MLIIIKRNIFHSTHTSAQASFLMTITYIQVNLCNNEKKYYLLTLRKKIDIARNLNSGS